MIELFLSPSIKKIKEDSLMYKEIIQLLDNWNNNLYDYQDEVLTNNSTKFIME